MNFEAKKHAGMTLIELSVAMLLISLMAFKALSTLHSKLQQDRVHRLALDLQRFIALSRSMALRDKQDLWGYLHFEAQAAQKVPQWQLCLSTQMQACEPLLMSLHSRDYPQVYLTATQTAQYIKFTGMRGKVSNGHFLIRPTAQSSQGLKVIFFYGSPRIKLCALHDSWLGYAACA